MNQDLELMHNKKKGIVYGSFSDLMKERKEEHYGKQEYRLIGLTEQEELIRDEIDCITSSSEPILPIKPHCDLEDSIIKIKELRKELTLNRKIALMNETVKNLEKSFTDMLPSIFLTFIENRVEVTNDAKQVLKNDINLLSGLKKVIENISLQNELNFEINKVDIGYDPDIPEWKPIKISLKIKSTSFKMRLKIKHMITRNAFQNLDEKARKNIYITGAI